MSISQTLSKSEPWDVGVDLDETRLFEALQNARCRLLLGAIGEQPLTVAEIASTVEIPVSTLYRQLGELVETGILQKSIRLDPNGQHATQYANHATDITIDLSDGFTVTVS